MNDMAAKSAAAVPAEKPVLKAAEDWALEKKVPGVYLAGVKYRNKWGSGKALTEKEFDAALKEFLTSAADGRKK